MARVFYDKDANYGVLKDQTVAVVGYGNQGRSQALNMRDSGLHVIVGNEDDSYAARAKADGMSVFDVAQAAAQANVIMMLVPDEVQSELYDASIAPGLKEGSCLVFSHGYNIFYGLISPPKTVDVVLVAPRMIGEGVRRCFESGGGFPTVVGVHQDSTGKAWARTLALAKAIGGSRMGAWESTFEEETVIDLFDEQVGGGSTLLSTIYSFETLVDAGYNPEVVLLELYASGELAEVFRGVARYGLLESLRMHSRTSQYGQMSRAPRLVHPEGKETLRAILDDIRSGAFAKEWGEERKSGYAHMEQLRSQYGAHPMFRAERRVKEALRSEENTDQAE